MPRQLLTIVEESGAGRNDGGISGGGGALDGRNRAEPVGTPESKEPNKLDTNEVILNSVDS